MNAATTTEMEKPIKELIAIVTRNAGRDGNFQDELLVLLCSIWKFVPERGTPFKRAMHEAGWSILNGLKHAR